MPLLPPTKDVLDALQNAVIPATGMAALIFCFFHLPGKRAAPLAAAAAMVGAYVFANLKFPSLGGGFGGPVLEDEYCTGRLFPWRPDEVSKPWEWLPRVALTLLIVGVASRWFGSSVELSLPSRRRVVSILAVWLPRVVAAAVSCRGLVSPRAAAEMSWLAPALTAVVIVEWIVLDAMARTESSAFLAASLGGVMMAAAAVLLHHHWLSVMELAVIAGCSLIGVAIAAGALRSEVSGAMPAVVAILPGLMLSGRLAMDSGVPLSSFWLIGLAPLALLIFFLPPLSRWGGWRAQLGRAVVVLIPAVIAIALAAKHETLPFDE